jgi:hypothetical protein
MLEKMTASMEESDLAPAAGFSMDARGDHSLDSTGAIPALGCIFVVPSGN